MERSKRAGIAASLALLVASIVVPAFAAAGQSACPSGYTLNPAPPVGTQYWADRNGDLLQCDRVWQQGSHIRISNRDNKIV